MGKVFSSSELTQGAYPEPGAHNNIAEQLMHDVRSIAATHNIPVAAMVYGSVAVAAATRTSDIDFLLVHEVEEAKVAVPALQFSSLARHYQAAFHVPISVNFIARAHMAERYSLQDPLFTENLTIAYQHSPERFVFGNPIAGMATLAHLPTTELRHDAALSTTHSYINERIARIVEAFAESTINPEIALKVAINLPSTLGRKIARVAEIHHALMHDMSSEKTAIGLYDRDAALSAYHDILSDTDDQAAITALRGLATIANNYRAVLEDTIRRARTVTDYDEWLKHHVTEAVLPSLELCCSALRYLRTIDCRNTLPPAGP